jgi:hypothetical protein
MLIPRSASLSCFQPVFSDQVGGDLNGQFMGNRSVVAFLNRGTHTRPLHSSLGWRFRTHRTRYGNPVLQRLRIDEGNVVEDRVYDDLASNAHQSGLTKD